MAASRAWRQPQHPGLLVALLLLSVSLSGCHLFEEWPPEEDKPPLSFNVSPANSRTNTSAFLDWEAYPKEQRPAMAEGVVSQVVMRTNRSYGVPTNESVAREVMEILGIEFERQTGHQAEANHVVIRADGRFFVAGFSYAIVN